MCSMGEFGGFIATLQWQRFYFGIQKFSFLVLYASAIGIVVTDFNPILNFEYLKKKSYE